MAAEQKEETEKRIFEPIFMGYNESAKTELICEIEDTYKEVLAIKEKLDEKGIKVTKNTISDCLSMVREDVPIGDGIRGCKTVYRNTEHLDEAFARQLAEETNGVHAKLIRDNLKEHFKLAAIAFKDDVLKLRAGFDEMRFNLQKSKEWLIISEDGEISLPEDLEERAAKESGFWIKTEAQNEAYEAHKNAAQALTEFLSHFQKSVWPSTMEGIGRLFKASENGGFAPVFIDYSYYIK
uniref:hypothetical protein n=1 Tax=Alloprevotella sp. TaxID=1872471 RepID=UPI003FF0D40B